MAASQEDATRSMNDTTMPPPKNRSSSSSSSNSISSSSSGGQKSPRKKSGLRKGFGLQDWALLVKSSKNLAQRSGSGLRRITRDEVRQHNTIHDGWTILHGKVYNIAPYLHYHPGGVQILKPCLGRDATSLFEKYHRWVNADGLIGSLLLGYLETTTTRPDPEDSKSYLPQKTVDGFSVPAPRPPKKVPALLSADADDDDDEEDDPLASR